MQTGIDMIADPRSGSCRRSVAATDRPTGRRAVPASRRRGAAIGLLVLLALAGCASLPERGPVTPSRWLEPPRDVFLHRAAVRILAGAEPDESAFLLLRGNEEALDWRLALVDRAEHTLDLQYFIWHGDATGSLLAERVLQAADRGVRVRLLVDDFTLGNADDDLVGYSRHDNVEVRTFNPWATRRGAAGRGLEFAGRIKRLNTRMHNKLISADGRMAIVGGRNIGDEYFGLATKYNFYDLDVLAVGPIVAELGESFDLYWNSETVYPAAPFEDPKRHHPGLLDELRRETIETIRASSRELSSFPLEREEWSEEFARLESSMHRGTARVIFDEPAAGVPADQVLSSLAELAEGIERELLMVTAYLVPDDAAVADFAELSGRGVEVGILTNSLASTDMAAAHSGYAPMRRDLLAAGVDLRELRMDAAIKPLSETPPVRARFVGLHSKAIVLDGSRVFVGSLNFDPRSLILNTEMGVVVESEGLGAAMVELYREDTGGENAWKVSMDEMGRLRWESERGVVARQPSRGILNRLQGLFFRLLPLKGQV